MQEETDIVWHYLAELDEIADLDRCYYRKKSPSPSERASYALRQEYLEQIRKRFTPGLNGKDRASLRVEALRSSVRDKTQVQK